MNLQPLGPEPSALPSCATSRDIIKSLAIQDFNFRWSGKQDLNLQPLGPKPSALPSCAISRLSGAPEGIRTPDLLVRSQTLYPAELRAHLCALPFKKNQMVASDRIELPTRGFSVLCSTD